MTVQKKPGKLKPENGYPQFKSPRDPGKANTKPSVPDSGNPMGQFTHGSPANWKSGGPADSGKPTANR